MKYRAGFMPINGMVLRLGQTLGPILIGTIFFIWGMTGAFVACAGLSLIMFILLVIMVR